MTRKTIILAGVIAGLAAVLLCPRTFSRRTNLQGNASVLVVPFNLIHDHVLVDVRLNDAMNAVFMADTGATDNVVDNDAAKKVGLQISHPHERYGAGLGEGKTTFATVKGIVVSMGGKEIFRGGATGLLLKSFGDEGVQIDGILGRPFFKRFVVEIDYARHLLKLYDAHSYSYQGSGYVIPIHVDGDPFIQTELTARGGERIHAKLEVDTGSDGVVLLNRPFQLKHTVPRAGEVTVAAYAAGIGGDYDQRLGRLEALQIGDLEIQKPLVVFPDVERGAAASGKFDGSIGGKLLERFDVIFDYSRKEMILEPNSHFSEPFKANVSGIWFSNLVRGANHIATGKLNMSQDSPLVRAGFRQGDNLVAIDGKPTTDYSQDQLEALFSEEGTTITVTVERDGKRVDISFTTPKLL